MHWTCWQNVLALGATNTYTHVSSRGHIIMLKKLSLPDIIPMSTSWQPDYCDSCDRKGALGRSQIPLGPAPVTFDPRPILQHMQEQHSRGVDQAKSEVWRVKDTSHLTPSLT